MIGLETCCLIFSEQKRPASVVAKLCVRHGVTSEFMKSAVVLRTDACRDGLESHHSAEWGTLQNHACECRLQTKRVLNLQPGRGGPMRRMWRTWWR